jgi:hypothetical protein
MTTTSGCAVWAHAERRAPRNSLLRFLVVIKTEAFTPLKKSENLKLWHRQSPENGTNRFDQKSSL